MTEEKMYIKWRATSTAFKIRDIEKKASEIRKQRNRERLKPCPFCGGKAHIHNVSESDGHCRYEMVCVTCEDCGAQSIHKVSDGYYELYCTDEEIAEIWNRRVIEEEAKNS